MPWRYGKLKCMACFECSDTRITIAHLEMLKKILMFQTGRCSEYSCRSHSPPCPWRSCCPVCGPRCCGMAGRRGLARSHAGVGAHPPSAARARASRVRSALQCVDYWMKACLISRCGVRPIGAGRRRGCAGAVHRRLWCLRPWPGRGVRRRSGFRLPGHSRRCMQVMEVSPFDGCREPSIFQRQQGGRSL